MVSSAGHRAASRLYLNLIAAFDSILREFLVVDSSCHLEELKSSARDEMSRGAAVRDEIIAVAICDQTTEAHSRSNAPAVRLGGGHALRTATWVVCDDKIEASSKAADIWSQSVASITTTRQRRHGRIAGRLALGSASIIYTPPVGRSIRRPEFVDRALETPTRMGSCTELVGHTLFDNQDSTSKFLKGQSTSCLHVVHPGGDVAAWLEDPTNTDPNPFRATDESCSGLWQNVWHVQRNTWQKRLLLRPCCMCI